MLLVDWVIQIYIWILIASAILSWLVTFDVVNRRNPVVSKIGQFLYRVTEPVTPRFRVTSENLRKPGSFLTVFEGSLPLRYSA